MRSLKYYYSNKELVELKRKEYIQTEKYKIRRQNYLKENREEMGKRIRPHWHHLRQPFGRFE